MKRERAWLDGVAREGVVDQPLGQDRRFLMRHHPAHHVPAEDVQDHVEVELGPLRRSQQFGHVPGPDLVRQGRQQLERRILRMPQLIPPLPDVVVFRQDPVHGALRAQRRSLIEQAGVNLGWRLVTTPRTVHHGQDPVALVS